jgi:hypothetical protein
MLDLYLWKSTLSILLIRDYRKEHSKGKQNEILKMKNDGKRSDVCYVYRLEITFKL